jgi:hypothetical protein
MTVVEKGVFGVSPPRPLLEPRSPRMAASGWFRPDVGVCVGTFTTDALREPGTQRMQTQSL